MNMPRYLITLTHGTDWPDNVKTSAQITWFLGPIRKQQDFLTLILGGDIVLLYSDRCAYRVLRVLTQSVYACSAYWQLLSHRSVAYIPLLILFHTPSISPVWTQIKLHCQALIKAKCCPRVAAVLCTQNDNTKLYATLTFDVWPWNSIGFQRLSRHMCVRNFIKLSAAVHQLSCPQGKKTSRQCWKQYCRRYRGQ